jgi:hypothetical protein
MRLRIILFCTPLFWGCAAAQQTEGNSGNAGTENKKNVERNELNNSVNPALNNTAPAEAEMKEESVMSPDDYRTTTGGTAIQTSIPVPQPERAVSWYDFYLDQYNAAVRNLEKEISSARRSELTDVLNEMKNYHSNTYEYNLLMYIDGQHNKGRYNYLKKAWEIDPTRKEALPYLAAYNELIGDLTERNKFSKSIATSTLYGKVVYAWHRDLLAPLEKNAVLITQGDEDTYPGWALQANEGFRTDVKIVYLDLLQDAEYRKRLATELGITSLPAEGTDDQIRALCNITARPVYVSTTVRKDVLKEMEGKTLVLSGLAFKVGGSQDEMLNQFWQKADKRAIKDYWGTSVENQMKKNYLPALIRLYAIFTIQGESDKAKEVKETALAIAAKNSMSKQVEKYFAPK